MRYAFAGDRKISCNILQFLISKGHRPLALFVSEDVIATHKQELINLSGLEPELVFVGKHFKEGANIAKLKELQLDYVIGIHFPYIIPKKVLEIPKIGFLNLHPAYLPFNKGWHTPSWAILDDIPYGATLHFMEESLDEGDIIHQKQLDILPYDTANSLYHRALSLEEEVFMEAFEDLAGLNPKRVAQTEQGTAHNKKDLKKEQEISGSTLYSANELLAKLRALTTNNPAEAAYLVENGKRIGIQITMFELGES